MNKVILSVVVPVYAGENFLVELTKRLNNIRQQWIDDNSPVSLAEVIFVNDGSTDQSSKLLSHLSETNPWVSVLQLSRNFGQHAATIAGILHSSGDWIVTMDEDLQHPPEEIPTMLKEAAEGHLDIVYAKAVGQVHENIIRDFSSKSYKLAIERLTKNPNIKNTSSFRLIRSSIARGASSVCGHDTYFDIALLWFSIRIGLVHMNLRDARFIDEHRSGYNLRTLFSHGRKMLFSSDLKVLRSGALFGFLMVTVSAIGGAILYITKLLNPDIIDIQGWTSLMLAITLFGGLSLMFLGICLEYLSLLVQRAHGRPLFFTIDRSSDKIVNAYFNKNLS